MPPFWAGAPECIGHIHGTFIVEKNCFLRWYILKWLLRGKIVKTITVELQKACLYQHPAILHITIKLPGFNQVLKSELRGIKKKTVS